MQYYRIEWASDYMYEMALGDLSVTLATCEPYFTFFYTTQPCCRYLSRIEVADACSLCSDLAQRKCLYHGDASSYIFKHASNIEAVSNALIADDA